MKKKLFLTVKDYEIEAKKRIPTMFYDYIRSGSWTESTLRRNESDFSRFLFRQRVGRDLSALSTCCTLLGEPAALPVALAPCGMGGYFHADGELHARRAALNKEVPYCLSTMSIASIEDVASLAGPGFYFQLYVMRDRDFTSRLIERAKAAGCRALVLTLDLQLLGQRHRDLRNGLGVPPAPTLSNLLDFAMRPKWALGMLRTPRKAFGNIVGHARGVDSVGSLSEWTHSQFDRALTWADVARIRREWGGPLIIKGILDADDARMARDEGASCIVVSNHGGRQLDGAVSAVRALPGVSEALKGSGVEVWVDGGVRSGQDVLRARALGADGVMIGRPYLYGMGVDAQQGVENVLEILQKELELSMGFCGVQNINDVDRSILCEDEP